MSSSDRRSSTFVLSGAALVRRTAGRFRFLGSGVGMAAALASLPVVAPVAVAGEAPSADAGSRDFSPASLAYVLQADKLASIRSEAIGALAGCGRDLIIMDGAFYGDAASRWTPGELDRIREGKAGRRVVAYFSVGEAEDYRGYWKAEWETDPPPFILEENPHWKGNFRVKYWSKEWQAIILKELDKLIAQGFDGVYLDIVDAFEKFEYDHATDEWIDHRANSETGKTYRQDMSGWMRRIGEHAREKRPGFLLYPQNGDQLLVDAGYRAAVDGIGVEDLFTDGTEAEDADSVAYWAGFLDQLKADGKPVLCIDYSTSEALKVEVREKAAAKGYGLLITDRALTKLGESGGGAP